MSSRRLSLEICELNHVTILIIHPIRSVRIEETLVTDPEVNLEVAMVVTGGASMNRLTSPILTNSLLREDPLVKFQIPVIVGTSVLVKGKKGG